METYTISEETYREQMRKVFKILIPIVALGVLIVVGANLYTARSGDFAILAIVMPLFIAYAGFSYYRSVRKQTKLVLSYSLTVSDSEITRVQDSTPTITINFMEVKEIVKTKRGGFTIKGRTARDIIHVPHLIENSQELEQRLQAFVPITTTGSANFQQYQGLVYLLGISGYIAAVSVNNPLISVLAALAAIGVLVWLFITVQRSKNATAAMRRRSWFYLLMVLLLFFTIYTRIAGLP
jgi:hypothetical protein